MKMLHSYWSDWYDGWGWFLWFGIIFLIFANMGNWGYSYQAHQKYNRLPRKEAFDILSERYAKGEITQSDYQRMKADISA
jgi:putative membrane protein